MKNYIRPCLLVLILSCNSNEPEEPKETCDTCTVTGSDSLSFIVNNFLNTPYDTVWLSSHNVSNYQDYGICSSIDGLDEVEDQSVISAKVNLLEDCLGNDYVEILDFEWLMTCHPEIDTIETELDIFNRWRIYSFDNTIIPCEMEPSYLYVHKLDEEQFSIGAFTQGAKGRIEKDSMLVLFYHDIPRVLGMPSSYLTSNSIQFRSLFNDLLIPEDKQDTIKLRMKIENNILEISDLDSQQKIVFYTED